MVSYVDSKISLIVNGVEAKPFMTREEFEAFNERFYREIKPTIDAQMLARARSQEAARRHIVY